MTHANENYQVTFILLFRAMYRCTMLSKNFISDTYTVEWRTAGIDPYAVYRGLRWHWRTESRKITVGRSSECLLLIYQICGGCRNRWRDLMPIAFQVHWNWEEVLEFGFIQLSRFCPKRGTMRRCCGRIDKSLRIGSLQLATRNRYRIVFCSN